jgi:hypothetical protein
MRTTMAKEKKSPAKETRPRNQGEGNRTAARNYNREQRNFIRKGRVEDKAREAEKAIEGPEREELERAEAEGKRHIAEEDPEIKR